MEGILQAKALQCKTFREHLLSTADRLLKHNMENDGKWGIGPDGKGLNQMGEVLMSVRTWLSKRPAVAPTPILNLNVTPSAATPTPTAVLTSKNVLVIGNSNTRGIAGRLCKKGLQATGLVLSGRPSAQIKQEIRTFNPPAPPSHVFLHTGDIDARTGRPMKDTTDTVLELKQKFPKATILLNSPSACVDDFQVQQKMIVLRDTFGRMCQNIPGLQLIDSSRLRLWDNIHFTYASQHILADRIVAQVTGDVGHL
jgi:hypothetical protein